MRNHDPSYDAFYAEGPSVDDKWRSTYPYVPTSYLHQTSGTNIFIRTYISVTRVQFNSTPISNRMHCYHLFQFLPDRQNSSGSTVQRIGQDADASNIGGNSETNKAAEDGERGNWGSQWEFIFSCIGKEHMLNQLK